MSMRRSRLQIRPNLGARGAQGTKEPAGKTTDNKSKSAVAETVPQTPVSSGSPQKPSTSPSKVSIQPPKNNDVGHKVEHILESSSQPSTKSVPSMHESAADDEKGDAQAKPPERSNDPKADLPKPAVTGRRSRIKPQVKLPLGKVAPKSSEKSRPTDQVDHGNSNKAHTTEISKKTDTVPSKAAENKSLTSPEAESMEPTQAIKPPVPVKPSGIPTQVTKTDDGQPKQDDKNLPMSPIVRPIIKRGWFPKAKPNIPPIDKRRRRLSSMSDVEDSPAMKKPKPPLVPSGSNTAASASSTANSVPAEERNSGISPNEDNDKFTEIAEETIKKSKKTKRRSAVKLATPVSENRHRLTVGDLIYMNPTTNKMKRYRNDNNDDQSESHPTDRDSSITSSRPPSPSALDDAASVRSEPQVAAPPEEVIITEEGQEETDASMVPRVMIGPDGNIIIDDKSLVVDNPAHKADTSIVEGDIVVENDNYDPSFYYKRKTRIIPWSIKETTKFYLALSTVGTDFSLMTSLFPKRARVDLKRKFKIEEKRHKALIDRALSEKRELDMSLFDASSEDEEDPTADTTTESPRKAGMRKAVQDELQREKDARKRKSRAKTKINTSSRGRNKAKKNKKLRSHYYDNSEESENDAALCDDAPEPAENTAEGADDSSGDDCVIEKVLVRETKYGRKTKPVKPFQPEVKTKRTRRESLEAFAKIAPLVNMSPGVVPEGGMIEDHETGQRLLLVKSPPPVGSGGGDKKVPSEFVHVYLLSPSTPRTDGGSSPSRKVSTPLTDSPGTQHVHISGGNVRVVERDPPTSTSRSSPVRMTDESKSVSISVPSTSQMSTPRVISAAQFLGSPPNSISTPVAMHGKLLTPSPLRLKGDKFPANFKSPTHFVATPVSTMSTVQKGVSFGIPGMPPKSDFAKLLKTIPKVLTPNTETATSEEMTLSVPTEKNKIPGPSTSSIATVSSHSISLDASKDSLNSTPQELTLPSQHQPEAAVTVSSPPPPANNSTDTFTIDLREGDPQEQDSSLQTLVSPPSVSRTRRPVKVRTPRSTRTQSVDLTQALTPLKPAPNSNNSEIVPEIATPSEGGSWEKVHDVQGSKLKNHLESTSITTDKGEVLEILIDPDATGIDLDLEEGVEDEDGYRVYNIEVPIVGQDDLSVSQDICIIDDDDDDDDDT